MDKEIIDDLEEFQEEESKFKKLLKRTYIIFIALFMCLLLLVNTQTGYHLVSLISGKIVSSSLQEDYSFELSENSKVVFERDVFEALRQIWKDNQQHEFKVCLTGEKQENNYVVSGLYVPRIYDQEVYSVTSQICDSSTIISLHSHPPLRCIFSEQDIKSYESFNKVNPDGIYGLMCGEERLSFYGYQ